MEKNEPKQLEFDFGDTGGIALEVEAGALPSGEKTIPLHMYLDIVEDLQNHLGMVESLQNQVEELRAIVVRLCGER